MSGFFSSIFGGTSNTTQAAATPPAAATTPTGTDTSTNADTTQKAEPSPGDAFKELWDTSNIKAPEPIVAPADPAKTMEAVKNLSFTGSIPAELLTQVKAGGEAGADALVQAMDHVSRDVFAKTAMLMQKMQEQALTKAEERFVSQLPQHIKKVNLSDSLQQENPALTNPAFAPLVTSIQSQLALKFPEATAAELRAKTSQYFDELAKAAGGAKAEESKKQAASKETDWSSFLS